MKIINAYLQKGIAPNLERADKIMTDKKLEIRLNGDMPTQNKQYWIYPQNRTDKINLNKKWITKNILVEWI